MSRAFSLIYFVKPRLNFSARSVLLSTIVIVKGPTPPGTGVIALAISFTSSYATSPFNFPFSSGVLPTSIITAPF